MTDPAGAVSGAATDILTDRLSKHVDDAGVVLLVRAYLNGDIMNRGVVQSQHEVMPQGGSLLPPLAKVLLDEVDKEVERCGHFFARYADDSNAYVRNERVMGLLHPSTLNCTSWPISVN